MQELSDKFPIVDERGNPNSYFIRFLQERGIGQGDLEKAIKALLLKKIVATDGGVTVAHGNFSDPLDTSIKTNLQFLLDALSASWGSILFRGAAGWQALGAGAAGQVLSTGGPAADPSWIAAGGGGGGNWWFAPPLASYFPVTYGTGFNKTDDAVAGLLINRTTVSSSAPAGASKVITTPAADWTMTAKFDFFAFNSGTATLGIACHNTAKNKFLIMGWDSRTRAQWAIFSDTGYAGAEGSAGMSEAPHWFRMAYVASTGIATMQFSGEGKQWWTLGTYNVKAFMGDPTNIGPYLSTESLGSTQQAAIVYWGDNA